MILLHSVDGYQQMHVLWAKYCTELDSLDPLQCNNTIYVGSVDYQEASYVSSFSFVVVYLVVGGLTKTLIVHAVFVAS